MKRMCWILALVLALAVAEVADAGRIKGVPITPEKPTESDMITIHFRGRERSGCNPSCSHLVKGNKIIIMLDMNWNKCRVMTNWRCTAQIGKLPPGKYTVVLDSKPVRNFTVAESEKGKNFAPELKKEIRGLIKNLGDKKTEVAEKAQKELIKLAEDAAVRPFVEEIVKGLLGLGVGTVKDPQRIAQRDRAVKILETIRKNLKARIASLIRKLGNKELKEWEAAQKELTEIGAPAIPFLKKELENKDSDVKARAKKIIGEIEKTSLLKLPTEAKTKGWAVRVKWPVEFHRHFGSEVMFGISTGDPFGGPDTFFISFAVEVVNNGKEDVAFKVKEVKLFKERKCVGEVSLSPSVVEKNEIKKWNLKLKGGERNFVRFHHSSKDKPFPAEGTKLIVVITLQDNKGNQIRIRTLEHKVITIDAGKKPGSKR
jgi:hypothetical protein